MAVSCVQFECKVVCNLVVSNAITYHKTPFVKGNYYVLFSESICCLGSAGLLNISRKLELGKHKCNAVNPA